MTIDATGLIQWTPASGQVGDHFVRVRVQDPGDLSATQSFAVAVAASTPPATVPQVVGLPQAQAEAALLGAKLTVGSSATASSATVPAGTVLSQSPAAGTTVAAGTAVNLVVSLGKDPATVPNVVGLPRTQAEQTLALALLGVGRVTTGSSATVPQGQVISQNPAAGTAVAQGSGVNLVVSLGAVAVTIPNVVGLVEAQARSTILAANLAVGAVTTVHSPTVPVGRVLSQSPTAGTAVPPASPVALVISLGPVPEVDADGDGFTVSQGDCNDTNRNIHPGAIDMPGNGIDEDCNGADAVVGDTTPPLASLTSPAPDAVILMPTDIIGMVNDANFLRYELSLARANDAPFTRIASGTAPVVNGVLGQIDPTLLENGIYRLRLTVEDVNGQTTATETPVRVQGQAKIGNFRISFIDLTVPVAGIPITIIRTYDSRVKTPRDFGVGWSLALKAGSYEHNRDPGEGWQIVNSPPPFGFPCRVINETLSHFTEVRLSDREFYTFKLSLFNPAPVFGGCVAEARFDFVDGSRPGATLQILGDTGVVYQSGTNEILDKHTFTTYHPKQVQLTTRDGRVFDLDRTAGITRMQDLHGNALSITPSGLVHSTGQNVLFTRDAQGRIIRITDPLGHTLEYISDVAGNLVTFIDPERNRTEFMYDTHHHLLEIRDPLGNRTVRTEYDMDGRLIATIDAQGNRREFTHHLSARQEVVRDRLGHVTVYEYDADGHVVSQTDALGHTTAYTYDSRGNQLTETDPLGRTFTKTYDAFDNVLTQTDFEGNVTTFTYNARGQVLSSIDARGRTTTNVYDANGNLRQTTDGDGAVTQYTYDAAGNLASITDPLGQVTGHTYDAFGNRTSTTDPLGNVTTFTYDGNHNALTSTRIRTLPDGSKETLVRQFEYDRAGLLSRVINGLGHAFVLVNNAIGQPESVTDMNGHVIRHEYDLLGRIGRTIYPDGSTATFTYDAEGRRVSRTDRDGSTTGFEYDALGRLMRTIYPDGGSTATTYDAVGRVLTRTDARGHVTTYSYTPHEETLTDALGNVTVRAFDSDGPPVRAGSTGSLVRLTDANGNVTTYAYDQGSTQHGHARLVKTTFPDGTTTESTYDAGGRKISETDQAGHTTSFAYDARGRLTTVTDALGGVTTYTHDEVGNRTAVTDANGNTARFAYDSVKRLTKRILPLGQAETFVYDAMGSLSSHTNFNGSTTTYAYDSNNRLIRKTLPDGSTVSYAYTPDGRRTQAGEDTYTYDTRGRLVQETKANDEVILYTYDAAGNRTAVTTTQGPTTSTYDALNRLATVSDPEGGVTTYSYDAVGNLTDTTAPNGTVTTSSYDTRNRLTQVETRDAGGNLLASYTYTLGPAGNRLRVVEGHTGRVIDYAYDALYRLTAEAIHDPVAGPRTIAYTYDAVGNRLAKNDSVAGVTTYSYDANNRLLTETGPSGTITYSYDGNGNLSGASGPGINVTYTYDSDNALTAADDGTNLTEYAYDADGLRMRAVVNGSNVTNFLVDKNRPWAQVLQETDGFGAATASYVYGRDLISMKRPTTGRSYYHFDGQRSTRQLTDASGTVSDTYTYDAFGNLLAATGNTTNNYRYSGEQLDPNLGFYYLRARYYDPSRGRFTAMDPFGGFQRNPLSLHKYVYAHNNPVNNRDPSGLFFIPTGISVGLGIQNRLVVQTNHPPIILSNRSEEAAETSLRKNLRLVTALNNARGMAQFFAHGGWQVSYSRWFGEWHPARADTVRKTWEKTNLNLQHTQPVFIDLDSTSCPSNAVAYTYATGTVDIYLCPSFWHLPVSGRSMPGVLLHEFTHAVADTDDIVRDFCGGPCYGSSAAEELASTHPGAATFNADNYEWQAEELF